jgi:imidazolonepropionase-like amidohydrolase
MAGPVIEDGVVLVRAGKIVAVGPAATIRIPEGVETLRAKVATPGLVDAAGCAHSASRRFIPATDPALWCPGRP